MTRREVINAVISTIEELRQSVFIPWDTGNMAVHGLEYEIIGDDLVHIHMNLAQAPYTPYTNEPWTAERWHGKQNPNEGWWNEWCDTFMKRLSAKLRGQLK